MRQLDARVTRRLNRSIEFVQTTTGDMDADDGHDDGDGYDDASDADVASTASEDDSHEDDDEYEALSQKDARAKNVKMMLDGTLATTRKPFVRGFVVEDVQVVLRRAFKSPVANAPDVSGE